MRNNLIVLFLSVFVPMAAFTQSVQIGTPVFSFSGPRAMLEVSNVPGSGATTALFGGALGISLQKNYPAIGFNQYNDNATLGFTGKYLGNGYAATMRYITDDPTFVKGLSLDMYLPGSTNAVLGAGNTVFNIASNGPLSLSSTPGGQLNVGRGTGIDGTAVFFGTQYSSHFNYSSAENTYIRAGKSGSSVLIGDANNGNIIFGEGATRVGINSADPTYTLEIRQVANSGIKMILSGNGDNWEWRASGSPTYLYAFSNGASKAFFNPTDGALNNVSDGRLKKNIKSLQPVMDNILQLNPVTYEMKADNPIHTRSIGFIAQEVEKVYPLLVKKDSLDKLMLLDYSLFGVLAIKGVQEQQQSLEKIDQKMQEAEMLLKRIEATIKAQTLAGSK